MDPNACLAKWENAVKVGDVGGADDAWYDLADWLRQGGFPPKWDDATRVFFVGYMEND